MPEASQHHDSRRDFFRGLANKRTLRSLGGVVGTAMGLLSKIKGEDSCEAAGMAVARESSPLNYQYRGPLAAEGTEGGSSNDTQEGREPDENAEEAP